MNKPSLSAQLAEALDSAVSENKLADAIDAITKAIGESSEASGQAMADIAEALESLSKKEGEEKAVEQMLAAFKDALVKAVAEIKVGVTVPEAQPPAITVQPATVTPPAITVQAPQITIPEPHVVVERQAIVGMRLKVNRSQMGLIETIDVEFVGSKLD